MRVNARLDEATQKQLNYLIEVTGQNARYVVRESLAQYCVQVKQKEVPSRFLAMVGKGNSGRSDIASNVSAHVADIIQRKHGLVPLQPLPGSQPSKRGKAPTR